MPKEVVTPQSPDSLRKIADELRRIAEEIAATAESMDTRKIDELPVTHYDSITKGMRFVTGFSNACRTALVDVARDRGDFRANGTSKTPKKGAKK